MLDNCCCLAVDYVSKARAGEGGSLTPSVSENSIFIAELTVVVESCWPGSPLLVQTASSTKTG